ncbi:hypothetical protein ACFQL1_23830 [Halomicroarcula sp. GCM10025709]|uniref:hypothetical protein n=1 Tax=Haloarcula TaxID=2237 RepID=UPI0024C2424F|nr:hypothetical protein [Halomicroarcula sp. YJ-61-S]
MHTRALLTAVLATTVLFAGCSGPANPPSPSADEPTPTATPAPVESLPAPAACGTAAVPRPDRVDEVAPSTYPAPPDTVTRSSVVNWTRAFETAFFRNELIAGAAGDDEQTLTKVTASVEIRRVNHTMRGYLLRLSDFGATHYASGIHGDHWLDVGYVVTETRVVRVPLDDRDERIRATDGTVVVGCQ